MAMQIFDFEGTDGAVLSGTGIALQGAGSAVFSAADAVVGGTGARFTATNGSARSARCTITSSKVYGFNLYLKTPVVPPSATYQMWTGRHTSGIILAVEYTAAQGISTYEQAGAIRTAIPSVTVAPGTWIRVQLLVSVGASTNDSTMTAKVFSSANNWTTQIGTALVRGTTAAGQGINLGTNAFAAMDVGAVTAVTPGLIVAADYLQADDGRTTDFSGPPTATAPTAVASTSNYYPEVGDAVNLSSAGSTSGGGALTYAWACKEWPDGTATPSIQNPNQATASFTPLDTVGVPGSGAGHYVFELTVTQAGGLTAKSQVTVLPHPHPGDRVNVYSAVPGVFVLGGGATSFVSALNGGGGYILSVANPTGQGFRATMCPFGPGAITFRVKGNWTGGQLNRTIRIFMGDGFTLLHTETWALTSVEAERIITLDAADQATASEGANRSALVVEIADGP